MTEESNQGEHGGQDYLEQGLSGLSISGSGPEDSPMKGQLGGSGVVPNFEVSVSFQTVRLTSTDPDAIQRFRQNREAAASRRITISRDEHIDEPVKKAISLGFKSKGIKDAANWADMPDAVFFRNMQKCFGECTPTTTKSTSDLDLLLADVENLTYDYDPRKAGGQACLQLTIHQHAGCLFAAIYPSAGWKLVCSYLSISRLEARLQLSIHQHA